MNHTIENQPTALARKTDIVVQEMPEEVLVYDLKSHQAHCLNPTAAFVWDHCDGQTTAAEIAALMEKEWRKPIGEDVVWLALQQLNKAKLLQGPLVRPDGEARVSRRAIMRNLGLGAAATLPLVISLIAPSAAMAATFPPVCAACVMKSDFDMTGCDPSCDASVLCTCYDNSGCGGGQFVGAFTCNHCHTVLGPPVGGTVSWKCP
jgi:hypothetical protein